MKSIGYILLAVGLALFIFTLYSFLQGRDELISPIPDTDSVKVIFISPAP